MILHLNHVRKESAAAATNEVVEALLSLLEEGHLEPGQFARMRIELDWIQYRQNFREPVMLTLGTDERDAGSSLMEVRIDARQVAPGTLREMVRGAIDFADPEHRKQNDRVYLEDFRHFRSSIAWEFNRLYWHRLQDWEQAAGRSYEQALPSGKSDANHPGAISDSVADFWTLARDLDRQSQLPAELFVMEIGVGMGTRASLWLDRFRVLDRERGTNFYPRLRFLLGDYSLATLERSRPAVREHIALCSFIVLDALDPIKTLSFLRHKILHIHLTNVYDNLPDEELVWRDGKLYWVQVRAYLPAAEAHRIGAAFGLAAPEIQPTIRRLLEIGPECLSDRTRGVAFWQDIWKSLRLEERLLSAERTPHATFPTGLDPARLEEILREGPSDLRFHLSSGALESFLNTVPLLHPRGYLQVQDIFVTGLSDCRMGFHGPGKLDGSIVNWVNGVLLREAAERAGYDIHFAPFHYRKESKTSVLYTSQRE
jgi:hypothetical protein